MKAVWHETERYYYYGEMYIFIIHSFRSLSNPQLPNGKGIKILKEDGRLREAWFIDGLRQGLGRTINNGMIRFIGECFNDKAYRGMEEYDDGEQYEGYLNKDGKYEGKGICVNNYQIQGSTSGLMAKSTMEIGKTEVFMEEVILQSFIL